MNSEDKFIIGIDLGNNSSTVSYLDFDKKAIEVVDVSGGYGKISVPTIISYNIDTKDWVFGEYAILNRGFSNELIIDNIANNLGKNISYNIDGEQVGIPFILSKFIAYLLEGIKNINPNANIEGIAISISSDINEQITNDIQEAFRILGIENLLIKIVNDKECILNSYMHDIGLVGDKILLIDYSNRQVRANIYKISNDNTIKCLKASFREDISEGQIFNITKDLIVKKFIEETRKLELTEYEKTNLDTFAYQQFDIIFQRQIVSDLKLYYNFYYPPFQKVLKKSELSSIILKIENEINLFLNQIFEGLDFSESDISNIILCGGGIEIDFIHRYIKSRFSLDTNFKGRAKRMISDGACLIASKELGIFEKDNFELEDLERLSSDIGLFINNGDELSFEPLAYKNSFIWQKFDSKIFLIDSKNIRFDIGIRGANDQYQVIKNIDIDINNQFLERDIKTIRLLIYLEFKTTNEMILNIEDFGFGEIFPKTDFKNQILIQI